MSEMQIARLAARLVERMPDGATRRLARLDPQDIPLALSSASSRRLDRRAVELLRLELSRLCRLRAEIAA